MKKILSILLALGLVLGISLSSVPVGAQFGAGNADWTIVYVDVDPDCELVLASYNITFDTNSSLTQGYHSISVMFPAGTGYPAVWRTGHITISLDGGAAVPVFAAEITQDGDVVTFLVPDTFADGELLVQFIPVTVGGVTTGVRNPPAGLYNLAVTTSRATMSTWVTSGWGAWGYYDAYIIRPTVSAYAFNLNFGPAYPGIAPNYIPPFKACGQDPAEPYNLAAAVPYVSYQDGDAFVTPFTLALGASPGWFYGCQPCPNMRVVLVQTGGPFLSFATLYDTTDPGALVTEHIFVAGDDTTDTFPLTAVVELDPIPGLAWNLGFHFDTVGTYTFDLVLIYTGTGQCELGCTGTVRELVFDVKQNKDAIAIPLYEKWNLVSLPLVPFDSSIGAMLATLPARASWQPRLLSIWNYDAFDGEWSVYGAGQDSLTDIVDGKSYWFRNTYTSWAPSALPVYTAWWVFGTEKPQPPMGPSEYPVAEGWNMVGFTSGLDYASSTYLWNWMVPPLPVVYGWTQGAWNIQGWNLIDVGGAQNLEVGQGYWMAFPAGGFIYVP